ncbi:polyprenyl synthetase family protein [Candidatus Woesearchaeota archaeon]|nr:polyprenyl synthetase family protein [Candidatus Woesearchaeota archaeon]
MDAYQTLVDYQQRVDQALQKFFPEKVEEARRFDAATVDSMAALSEFTLRKAKRLRAAFLYYGYACFADPIRYDKVSKAQKGTDVGNAGITGNDNHLLYASLAMELLQSHLLIHDDIMDRDHIRRGKPTIHVQYASQRDAHYGNSMALCIGNYGIDHAVRILNKSQFPSKRKERAIEELLIFVQKVIQGQIRDLRPELRSEQEILKTYELKSATYTVEGPLHVGAILAGARPPALRLLSRYALPLGIAFQLRDDINGLYGDEEKTGKPADSDVKQGKYTLLMARALAAGTPAEQATLRSALGNQQLTTQQLDQVREIVKQRSLDSIVALAQQKMEEAVRAIQDALFRAKGKEFLLGITDFIARRDH